MIYANKEKRKAAKEEKRQISLTRYKLYDESSSIEEYLLNTTVHGVAARSKWLDVFWWHYHFKDTPIVTACSLLSVFFFINILLIFAIRLLCIETPLNISGTAIFLSCFISMVFGSVMTTAMVTKVCTAYDNIKLEV